MNQYDFTAPFEGVVDHLYLDTKGLVTTGVGFMLPHLQDAEALPFEPPEAVQHDWLVVRAMAPGLSARTYGRYCQARLPEEAIRLEFRRRAARLGFELQKIWPAWDSFPPPCQFALFDMAWNMGAGALRRHWPRLRAAVERQDWAAAAKQCRRRGVQPARNEATRALFLSV